METFNLIIGIITMLVFVYAIIIIPRALGEMKGIYMETPDPFYGKFELDCKWTHGATYSIGIISYIIIIPILVLIWEQIMKVYGIMFATIILAVILIPFKIYYDRQKEINSQEAYKKNIEDGYLKETDPMPNTEGILTKICKKIR
ncbi:MAG: hypothetical protein BZ138_00430 [Methanosphaera sp. rholeuAM270]|nr:MAG: hypothetical protein BZ138_00430 [Methanosphaera sp. rholeuAM270]